MIAWKSQMKSEFPAFIQTDLQRGNAVMENGWSFGGDRRILTDIHEHCITRVLLFICLLETDLLINALWQKAADQYCSEVNTSMLPNIKMLKKSIFSSLMHQCCHKNQWNLQPLSQKPDLCWLNVMFWLKHIFVIKNTHNPHLLSFPQLLFSSSLSSQTNFSFFIVSFQKDKC